MTRTLFLCIKIALVVAAAVWLANRPGAVSIEWLGWRLENAPVGLLVLLALLVAAVAALIYRFWRFLYRAPGSIGRRLQDGRTRRGYKALNQGMLAVAAGDADEAKRWARKAENLLDEPPLTLLISAQAAQLGGDNQAAKRYFTAMLDSEETRFLGLRGLVIQALRDGDDEAALDYARKAQALRPKTPWVLTTLFELSERGGDLEAADRALKLATRLKALPATEARGKRVALLLERAEQAEGQGQRDRALGFARDAHKQAPDSLAAVLLLARLAVAAGRGREAQKVIERAWARTPHAGLAELYRAADGKADALTQVKRIAKLAAAKPHDPESHLAQAEACLAAELWGEARRHIDAAIGEASPSARVCRLMARLEEAENDDTSAARGWLERAGTAPADATWVCASCGAVAATWSAHCRVCDSFDSLAWGLPPGLAAPEQPVLDAEVIEDARAPA